MKRILALLALAISGFIIGCGGIESGTVVGKEYDDPDSWVYMSPIWVPGTCSGTGTTRTCTPSTLTGYIPIPMHDGPHWRLKLRDGDKKGRVSVDQETWNHVEIGQHWGVK